MIFENQIIIIRKQSVTQFNRLFWLNFCFFASVNRFARYIFASMRSVNWVRKRRIATNEHTIHRLHFSCKTSQITVHKAIPCSPICKTMSG